MARSKKRNKKTQRRKYEKQKLKYQDELHDDSNLNPYFKSDSSKKTIRIKPRSQTQEDYLDKLNDKNVDIILSVGPAGTGKTFLSTLFAIKQLLDKEIESIVITRPAVSVDESHGFLPGSLNQKMEPWVLPIMDVFSEHFTQSDIKKMLENKTIEFAPLAFMRGRTFKNAFIIADEVQNCTTDQVKMLLTRIGKNSKMVITGDLDQHDRTFSKNGLKDFTYRLKNNYSDRIQIIEFKNKDIQRHPVIEEVLNMYDDSVKSSAKLDSHPNETEEILA